MSFDRTFRFARLLVGIVWLGLAPNAVQACGACAEDKIAATYDHRVMTSSRVKGDVVVFCEVVGVFDKRRLARAAARVASIRSTSVRTSAQPAALSFAVDVSRQAPGAAVAALAQLLQRDTGLTIVRLVEPSTIR
ncbi:MAG: hypothetical protein ABIO71_13405 [Caldimonas sp.]